MRIRVSSRNNAVYPADVPRYVRLLKGFLGHQALANSQRRLDDELSHHGLCYRHLAMERRPWLFAVREYDAATLGGLRTLRQYPIDFQLLAGDGLLLSSLHGLMSPAVRAKYARDLLLDTHLDYMHELRTAWQYYLRGFHLIWPEPGQIRGPEFRVSGGGQDFDVECRHFGTDFSQVAKSPAVTSLCDVVYEVLAAQNRWGEVNLEIRDGYVFDSSQVKGWRRTLREAIEAGTADFELGPTVGVRWQIQPSPSPELTAKDVAALRRGTEPGQFTCVCTKQRNGSGVEAVAMRCSTPRRTGFDLRDHLYSTLKAKVKLQLGSDRAGVLVVKFSGISDRTVFEESEGMRSVLGRLFQQPQLSTVIFRCADVIESSDHLTVSSGPAVVYHNPHASYPAVQQFRHLS
ncbi:hypothetical protein [Tahibacter amnicola]|uniref:Uncharacterized protein n=1 Tax=Tahibacter amnicola TaxID=2976241 RepID=A0ABY6B7Y9_9GAMM|nr:hypothetical protein [Tahibacter amnicola]UXI66124.1 hypothetical protein N4264_15355 [Tahibacter amnicola]